MKKHSSLLKALEAVREGDTCFLGFGGWSAIECRGAVTEDGRLTPETIHSPDVEFSTYHVQGTLLGAETKCETNRVPRVVGRRVVNKVTSKQIHI